MFTNYGISGLAILKLSKNAISGLAENIPVEIEIDFFPKLTLEDKLKIIEKRVNNQPERLLEHFFTGWLNKRIGQTLLKSLGLRNDRAYSSLTNAEQKNIACALQAKRFKVTGNTGWQNAQITAGGVDTDEVAGLTLESKLIKGLFFAGEIIDIDGDSGGYNLQWAWSVRLRGRKSCRGLCGKFVISKKEK